MGRSLQFILAEMFKNAQVEPLEGEYSPMHPLVQNRRALLLAKAAQAQFEGSTSHRKSAMVWTWTSHVVVTCLDMTWNKMEGFLDEEKRRIFDHAGRPKLSDFKGNPPLPLISDLSDIEYGVYLGDRLKTLFLLAICYGHMNDRNEKNRLLNIVEEIARAQQNLGVLQLVAAERQ